MSSTVKVRPGGIALFGGTFDPLHIGHCVIAQQAWEKFELDRVIFIPCYQSPHKPGLETAPSKNRLAMLKTSLKSLSWAEVSDFEISRPGPSFSIETAGWFAAQNPGVPLYWIMGDDQWKVIEKWKEYRRLAELVTFIVFPRPLPPKAKKGIRLLQLETRVDISASMVRDLIRRGKPFHFFVPAPVHSHIVKHGLYSYES